MCDHAPNREAAMVVTQKGIYHRDADDERTTIIPGVWCDPCLEPLVRALNDGGMDTIASCCGHGRRPASVILSDGRWVLLMDEEDARRIEHLWPDINA